MRPDLRLPVANDDWEGKRIFLPVLLASRLPILRGARYLAYDVLRLRNVVEGLLESRPGGDTTVVLSTTA